MAGLGWASGASEAAEALGAPRGEGWGPATPTRRLGSWGLSVCPSPAAQRGSGPERAEAVREPGSRAPAGCRAPEGVIGC